jgi:hypothetical protein
VVRFLSRRSAATATISLLVFATTGFGVAFAKDHLGGGHPGLPVGTVDSAAQQVSNRVIVIMRDQIASQPATKRNIGARIQAEASADAPVISKVQRSGGRIHERYHTLNAFAATVSGSVRSSLEQDPSVKAVVPDQVVQLPGPLNQPTIGGASSSAGGATPDASSGVCPPDPAKPLLEPEALQTTHTAFDNPNTPQAQNVVTGHGVKVAFFADGLDINNPDFIRPDGSHVFIDYRDFSGDGPNAPTDSREAFGDASSIAAQGRVTYDISQFNNPAHPLPPGCNINVRGVAPGASLIGMKVFGNAESSFNSTILEGLDYALTNDHPDVISESFGGYPIPDTTEDLTRQFNQEAVAAGVTVVESSGDAGVRSSPSSAASDPAVIDAGGSTTFRNYAQGVQYAFQFSNGTWISDNISSIESAGFTQGGRTVDLVAPAEANWALCSSDTSTYLGCFNFAGQPTDLQSFGGTSESTPLIAGGAALIIEAYRDAHGGKSPSPALVRELLTSTSTDLGEPSFEEGAGEMNTLRAVRAAQSVHDANGSPAPKGENLLVTPNQTTVSGQAGSTPPDKVFKVTNVGASTETIRSHARQISTDVSNETGSVDLSTTSPTFVDGFGASVPYRQVSFHVPSGTDRLVAFDAWHGPRARVGMTLIDPSGAYAAYTRPQGNGNHGEVDVAKPAGGDWTAIIFRRDGVFNGPVQWQFTTQDYGRVGSVSPSTLTLAPGKTGKIALHTTLPSSAGDTNEDLVIQPSGASRTIVPIVLRSLVNLGKNGGRFSGNLIGGNGRDFSPAQLDTFDFNVPAGKPELSVSLRFPDDRGTNINGTLIDPQGHAVAAESNTRFGGGGETFTRALQAMHVNPVPGRWRFVVDLTNPVGGRTLSAPYSGRVSFAAPEVKTKGLPNSASRTIAAGTTKTASIVVNNPGPASEDLFLDPRLPGRQPFSLLSLTPDTNLDFPLAAGTTPPLYLIPTETNRLDAAANATEPVTFDFGFGDPDIAAISHGNTAAASFSAREATPGVWDIAPTPIGPFSGPAPSGKVSTGLVANMKPIDLTAVPSTGDVWQGVIDPHAPGFRLKTIPPGGRGKMTLAITPTGKPGKVVRGTLYVDNFSQQLFFGNELLAIPYSYTIG